VRCESPSAKSAFDRYATEYDAALAAGLSVSGEDKEYFARGRIAWLSKQLAERSVRAGCILDFGCGTGSATPYLLEILGAERVIGVDLSVKSLEVARQQHGSPKTRFLHLNDHKPSSEMDLAFCNGVFHHIPPAERAGAVRCVYDSLRAGGWFAFWENNPWNPGTRYVMSRIPFDRDAIMLSAPEARRLLAAGGFEVVCTDFLFIFPRALSWLRRMEPALSSLPLGAQYQVLARKPERATATVPA
jgi:SAM-dependent methyltransferase